MSEEKQSVLSSVDEIKKTVRANYLHLDFAQLLTSFVVNRQYMQTDEQGAAFDYMWNALSAIGQDVFQTVYENVRNYVDVVSNIDSCKVKSLASMASLVNLKYDIDGIDKTFPNELLDMFNVFSVTDKKMLQTDFVNDSLLSDISGYCCTDLGQAPDVSAATSAASSYNVVFSEDDYENYISCAYATMLSAMLCMKYNSKPQRPVAMDIDGVDAVHEQEMAAFISEARIDPKFDYVSAADEILRGNAVLDDYTGSTRTLLEKEIAFREEQPRDFQFGSARLDRYAYSMRAKVREYRDFIDGKYYFDKIQTDSQLQSEVYKANPKYWVIGVKDDVEKLDSVIESADETNGVVVNKEIFDAVVDSLVKTTIYVRKLRDKMKLQCRKYYMKGTNTLLIYVINEFIVDYIRNNKYLFQDGGVLSSIGDVYERLSSHDSRDIQVVEYYDETEYYNLSSSTSRRESCVNGAYVNEPFWSDHAMQVDGKTFTRQQIEEFYLSSQEMQDIGTSEDLREFLDIIYGVGADPSFATDEFGNEMFSTKLRNGKFSDMIYAEYRALVQYKNLFDAMLEEGYEHDYRQTIDSQISSAVESASRRLSAENLSDVSVVYDKYIEDAEKLSDSVYIAYKQYNDMLSNQEFRQYFTSSDCVYCRDPDDPETGYRHDFYIDNPAYAADMLFDKINTMNIYVTTQTRGEDNIQNFVVLDTLSALSSGLYDLSSRFTALVGEISPAGYVDLSSDNFTVEFDYAREFIQQKLNARMQYLQNLFNGLREQANNLKGTYDGYNQTIMQAVAGYMDNDPYATIYEPHAYAFSLTAGKKNNIPSGADGECNRSKKPPSAKKTGFAFISKCVDNDYYYYLKNSQEEEKGKYYYQSISITPYQDSMTLEAKCDALVSYLIAPTSFDVIVDGDKNVILEGSIKRTHMQEGIYASVMQVKNNINEMETTLASIIQQLAAIGLHYEDRRTGLLNRILDLIEWLSINMDEEAMLGKDELLKKYRRQLAQLVGLSADFMKYDSEYGKMKTECVAYFQNYTHGEYLCFSEISNANAYRIAVDTKNKEGIVKAVQELYDTHNALFQQYEELVERVNEDIEYSRPGGYLEDCIAGLATALADDVARRTDVANAKIDEIKETRLYVYSDLIRDELSAVLSSTGSDLDAAVRLRQDELNFFDDPQWLDRREMFLTYGGRDFCYYPYQNIKNQTHPTYQVHPFLWNFIEKGKLDLNGLGLVFYGQSIQDFEGAESASKLSAWYGDFGQLIDKWKHPLDALDFSGYSTRYEVSRHLAKQMQSEVVDYDGPFYPPAVEDLFKTPESYEYAVRSVSAGQSIDGIAREVVRSESLSCLKNYSSLTAGPISTQAFENEYGEVVRKYVCDVSCAPAIYGAVSAYAPAESADIAAKVDAYFKARAETLAVEYSFEDMVSAAYSGLEETFFGKFYGHLQLEDVYGVHNKDLRSYIAEQMLEYKDEISDINAEHDLSDVYDVFRYGVDVEKTQFTLYKRYGAAKNPARPTYMETRNELGWMWARLDQHPLSFPLFHGAHPQCDFEKTHKMVKESAMVEAAASYMTSADAKIVYDFDMSENGQFMYLALRSGSPDVQIVDPATMMYENPQIAISRQKTDTETKRPIFAENSYEDIQGFRSGNGLHEYTKLSSMPEIGETISNYAFIGSFSQDNDDINFVFAEKEYSVEDRKLRSSLKPTTGIKIMRADAGHYTQQTGDFKTVMNTPDASNGDIAFSFCSQAKAGKIRFAYVKDVEYGESTVPESGTSAVISSNVLGPVYDDPTTDEMNSHDIFKQSIRMAEYTLRNRSLRLDSDSLPEFNLNADMSYMPVYPGLSGMADFGRKMYDDGYVAIELLGTAKSVDDELAAVNDDVNPYLDIDSAYGDLKFGRVYEDWLSSYDKTLQTFENPTISDKSGQVVVGEGSLDWEIDLSPNERFSHAENYYDKAELFIYSKATAGKNPYYIGSLNDFSGREVSLNYNDQQSAEDAKILEDLYAAGVYDGTSRQDVLDSNHIDGISAMTGRFDPEQKKFVISFKLDESADQFTHVDKGQISFVLYNRKDLQSFEYYHYFDAYGAVNCRNATNVPDTISGDGWRFVYDINKIQQAMGAKNGADSGYFIDQFNKMRYLDSVHLSDYDALSDVYVLRGDRRLSYKYSEELLFELSSGNYFYPVINWKYPKLASDNAAELVKFYTDKKGNMLEGLFGENNLFIMDFELPADTIDRIQEVDVPDAEADNAECPIAFEDYAAVDEETGLKNFEKYDAADPRALQYVKFDETENVIDQTEIDKAVDECMFDEDGKCREMDEFLELLFGTKIEGKSLEHMVPNSTESGKSMSQVKYSKYFIDGNIIDEKAKEFLTGLMRVYANYKKDKAGITLYFNCFNKINTPFIKIQNSLVYPVISEDTWLKIGPGQDGVLQLKVQFKRVQNGKLLGYCDITLASYRIYNLSDDKPKFLVKKLGDVAKTEIAYDTNVSLVVEDSEIDAGQTSGTIRIGVDWDHQLKYPARFSIVYPAAIKIQSDSGRGYYWNEIERGYAEIQLQRATPIVEIPFEVDKSAGDFTGCMFSIELEDYDIRSENGRDCAVQTKNGTLTFLG